jgi:hypothetical protein
MARKIIIPIGFESYQEDHLRKMKEDGKCESIAEYVRKLIDEDLYKCKSTN